MKLETDDRVTEGAPDQQEVPNPVDDAEGSQQEPSRDRKTRRKGPRLVSMPRRPLSSQPAQCQSRTIVQEDLEEMLLYMFELREAKARYQTKKEYLLKSLLAGAVNEEGIHRAELYTGLKIDGRPVDD